MDDRVGEYGQLIFDECHHLSAGTFGQVARRAKGRFITGLSATVTRKDGQHPAIFMQCDPIRYRVDPKIQAREHSFTHSVFVRPTGFRSIRPPDPDLRNQFHDLYDELIVDGSRNRLIQEDILQAVRRGRSPLVLTERKEHLEELARRLPTEIRHLIVLRGGLGRKEMKAARTQLESLPPGEERVLLATGRFPRPKRAIHGAGRGFTPSWGSIGEGFDVCARMRHTRRIPGMECFRRVTPGLTRFS